MVAVVGDFKVVVTQAQIWMFVSESVSVRNCNWVVYLGNYNAQKEALKPIQLYIGIFIRAPGYLNSLAKHLKLNQYMTLLLQSH